MTEERLRAIHICMQCSELGIVPEDILKTACPRCTSIFGPDYDYCPYCGGELRIIDWRPITNEIVRKVREVWAMCYDAPDEFYDRVDEIMREEKAEDWFYPAHAIVAFKKDGRYFYIVGEGALREVEEEDYYADREFFA